MTTLPERFRDLSSVAWSEAGAAARAKATRNFIERLQAIPLEQATPKPRKPKPERDPDALLTAAQAASYLAITVEQLLAHVEDGAIKYINVGRGKKRPRYQFDPTDLDIFKDSRTITEPPCQFLSPKNPRPITGSTSKSNVVGFTALRAARMKKTPSGSKR